ncbi:MAG: hypothetical protein IH965_05760 [Gemmatimonadetes bacterium]|nr:hypothetical protein [Gemmatimonadota bacterium]
MRIDTALLRAAQEGGAFLRLYRWNPPCLSFGRNEPAATRYDRARIEALGLDVVRRPTGGRAVWHDTEVTYAVAAPVALFGSLRVTYHSIHATIVAALRRLGVPATLADGREPVPHTGAGACFASPAGGEVTVDGRKLVGSAQTREGEAFLQHGSILLADAQGLVADLTVGSARAPAAVSLAEVLGRAVTFAETSAAIADAARASWRGVWEEGDMPTVPADDRFADPAWTWRR